MTQEYEVIDDNSPIAQGDLFEWVGAANARPWRNLGVIVTADCDLEHGKSDGRLSYVPALIAEDYFWYFWKNKRLAQEHKNAIGTLAVRTAKILSRANPDQKAISPEAMTFMLSQHGANLPSILGLTNPGDVANYRRPLDVALAFEAIRELPSADIDKLIEIYGAITGKTPVETAERLAKDFQAAIGTLPGDVFHITTQLGQENGGLFLMLRAIEQCAMGDVTYRPDELRFGNAKAKRLGRVAGPFRYSMTQALGRVFSDIGLPNEYEARRAQSSLKFFETRGQK